MKTNQSKTQNQKEKWRMINRQTDKEKERKK